MLLELHIKNFALIEEVKINFSDGFNILCGETGSGKSILIDSMNFVLGGKFSKNLIRSGENKTYVGAVFLLNDNSIDEMLGIHGIEKGEYLIITRETFKYGKTIARINNVPVNLSVLNTITEKLLDIHGQHHNIELLDSKNHIAYLDHYGEEGFKGCKKDYGEMYERYLESVARYKSFISDSQNTLKRIEFLKFQMDDIDKLNIRIGEDVELKEQYDTISNSEKIKSVVEKTYLSLNGGEYGENSVYDILNEAISNLKSIEPVYGKITQVIEGLNDAFYSVEEGIRELRSQSDDIYYDKNELEWINERLFELENAKKKYGDTLEDILAYYDGIKIEVDELNNRDFAIEKLELEIENYKSSLKSLAEEIHNERKEIAKKLVVKINTEMKFVGLEKSVFDVGIIKNEELNENGYDKVEFLISTNPGDPLRALGAIVSGGELSRVMLALKATFIDKDKVFSVVFDEIDTGISGKIAQRVGEKMYSISKEHQVFCVTHLPQIACFADYCYRVEKKVINDRTFTNVIKLDDRGKVEEIAKMSGGDNITDIIMEHAKEMISQADIKKIK